MLKFVNFCGIIKAPTNMTHISSPISTLYPYCSSRFSTCQWGIVEFRELCRYAQNNRGDIVFYDRFVYLCTKKGVSPSRAAVEAGISKSLVTKWKTNNLKDPSPDILRKLAKYFNLSVSELLGEEDQKEKPLVNEDKELTEYLEILKTRPEMRMLFQLSKDATKEDVEAAVRIIEALRNK